MFLRHYLTYVLLDGAKAFAFLALVLFLIDHLI